MIRWFSLAVASVISMVVGVSPRLAHGQDAELSKQVYAVFKKNCASCHHEKRLGNKEYDVLDFASLTKTKPSPGISKKYPKATAYIKPKATEESLIILRVDVKEMPPRSQPQPSDEERQTLRRWVEAGASREGFGP